MTDVKIEHCRCGHASCKTYGVSNGTFYQGCGWDKESAEFVAWCFNHREQIEKAKNILENMKP